MQGRGITNYDTNKPSHELTTSTTEFDDELIRRGIVSTEQVMMAKGATPEEAMRLAEEKNKKPEKLPDIQIETIQKQEKEEEEDHDSEEELLQEESDQDFFAKYRQERLAQLKHETSTIPNISREEWTIHVNQASFSKWILVILWDEESMRTQDILQDLQILMREYSGYFGIVRIDYLQANPQWPTQRVPAIFAYRDGVKQQEYITTIPGKFPTPTQMVQLLSDWDIILD